MFQSLQMFISNFDQFNIINPNEEYVAYTIPVLKGINK